MIVKNTYGISVAYSPKQFGGKAPNREFTGSASQRKKQPKKQKNVTKSKKQGVKKLRSMSHRTKQKIRKKISAFSRCYKRLSFVTLTFLNEVSDEQGIILLRKFIDNVKKRSNDFQYVWVIERQTKNKTFKNNIHFHMITNKYWDINKWMTYWIELQKKNGITPRKKDFKPTSSFDVKQLNTNNIRRITSYVTKYVTKNNAKFNCQVWNCSKKVSLLYTDFYTGEDFIENFKKLNAIKKTFEQRDHRNRKFLDVKIVDVNKKTLPLYIKLDRKNEEIIKTSIR